MKQKKTNAYVFTKSLHAEGSFDKTFLKSLDGRNFFWVVKINL